MDDNKEYDKVMGLGVDQQSVFHHQLKKEQNKFNLFHTHASILFSLGRGLVTWL